MQAEGTILTILTNARRQKKARSVLGTADSFELVEREMCGGVAAGKLRREVRVIF